MSESAIRLPVVPALPHLIRTGEWTNGHIQGIAVDKEHKYIYYSFTTVLVKSDIDGNVVGCVSGLTGHLGCISFNNEDGKLYGSIEYKHDSIGRGIMANTGIELADEDAFYCAVFDVDKIDRMDMDAEKDGIMKTVYLPDVVEDFNGKGLDGKDHRYACSGIDGTAFGPDFGAAKDSEKYLFIAYGIYTDNERADNDNQVILKLDWRRFGEVAQPLTQGEPHHSGQRCEAKYFLYTGSTNWGIQNLEYDAMNDGYLAAVYLGKKPEYRNPPMFIIDQTVAPAKKEIYGLGGEQGICLELKKIGVEDEAHGVWGNDFHVGTTGIYAFGNGYYYFSYEKSRKDETGKKHYSSTIKLCRFTGITPELFEIVPDTCTTEGNMTTDTYKSSNGADDVFYRLWRPEGDIKGVFQIVHGMCEHSARYAEYAEHLCSLGFAVAAEDHLGHGKTSPKEEDRGYFGGIEGYRYIVEDIHTLTEILHEEFPGAPLVILGHSMGSFLTRVYLTAFGEDVDGAIIMGTAGPGKPLGFGMFLCGLVSAFRGDRCKSGMLRKLTGTGNLKRIAKPCSEFAWLTKDEEIVKAYEDDPDCGFTFTSTGYRDLFAMMGEINTEDWAKEISIDLPILLVSGAEDPIGDYGKGVRKVAGLLAAKGAKNLTVKLFPCDRHEILNETDRQEVYTYIDGWAESVLAIFEEKKAKEADEE